MKVKRLAVLLGAGVDHTDTDAFDGYGFQGLVGAKFAISDVVALRADGIRSWMSNPNGANNTGHLGLSIYRKPRIVTSTVTRTVTRDMPQPPVAQRPDSVSAAETLRLRGQEARYLTLRDSLARPVEAPYMPASSAAALATMQQMIYFGNNSSELSDSAKAVLLAKVAVFRTNPAMRIVIAGFTSRPGTEPYNMALGLRRAEAAKAYLVTQGVDPVRIELATRGEGQLVLDGPGETADAANRRGQFRLLVADPYLINPQR